MKANPILCILAIAALTISGCKNEPSDGCVKMEKANRQLDANLKMYVSTWDAIINKRRIDLINDKNFDTNITLVAKPQNIVGIQGFKDYYNNFLVGFSDIQFTVVDAFGQGDKIVKHWIFKGKHTGTFFGIPATGKQVTVEGTTLVQMKDGKILQEQDFMENLDFMQQLGLIPKQ